MAIEASNTQKGHTHPITHVINEIARPLIDMGFEVALGPEMESEHYNFDVLNVPRDHPSRDMQDTFWIKGLEEMVLRTQTSAVQGRYMEAHKPPFKIIVPGKVFRNEATDMTHDFQFYQFEGLVVGEGISLAHLKGTLNFYLRKLFGDDVQTQFRPGFFPFVEPGVEIDMVCFRCKGDGCPTCKQSGWIEILGAGMVHPNVLEAAGIDSKKYSGFAFGPGVERLAMLKFGVEDIRLFSNGDLRVVTQF
jgi:phenylalanyl-tRNA synthetase alpha chain